VKAFDPRTDYPLSTSRPDLVRTPSALTLEELTLEHLRGGQIPDGDLKATAETLRLQAAIARAAGRDPLAVNLERAAELSDVPNELILDLYTALRPRRSTPSQLEAWAERLEKEFEAPTVAAFVRDAKTAYETVGLFS
jgi:propanediol dehydratase small subunit